MTEPIDRSRAPRPGDRFLVAVVLLGLTFWLARAHWDAVDAPNLGAKVTLHEAVLSNEAPDPYQYKLWAISHACQAVHERLGLDLDRVFWGNTALSLLFLVLLHHAWLRTYGGPKTALVGGLVLGALASVLFLNYWHHPYEFWGVGLYCLLLLGIARDWSLGALIPLALVTGLVWEKHAVLPLLWGLWSLQRGRPFGKTLLGGLLFLAASLAVPVLLRLLLGTDREAVDGTTTWAVQPWGRVLETLVPYVLPFLAILVLRFRLVPVWVRWLWLALPIALLAYVSQSFIVHEVRSFWLLAPIFTATFCAWIAPRDVPAPPTP